VSDEQQVPRPIVPSGPGRAAHRPDEVLPLDPPMVPFVVAGMAVWAAVGLVLLVFFRGWLSEHGHTDWLWTCLAGFLLGFVGLAVMIRHDANRRRRSVR
jgi:hypothetical protein